jgi:hypothetical protein
LPGPAPVTADLPTVTDPAPKSHLCGALAGTLADAGRRGPGAPWVGAAARGGPFRRDTA